MEKLKWFEHPTYFLNNFEVKDPVGFDQRLTLHKLQELMYRKDLNHGWRRIELKAHPISSLTQKEIDEFMEMGGLGKTIGNKHLIEGYLNGEIMEYFPWWLMVGLLEKGILPEPIFSKERVVFV